MVQLHLWWSPGDIPISRQLPPNDLYPEWSCAGAGLLPPKISTDCVRLAAVANTTRWGSAPTVQRKLSTPQLGSLSIGLGSIPRTSKKVVDVICWLIRGVSGLRMLECRSCKVYLTNLFSRRIQCVSFYLQIFQIPSLMEKCAPHDWTPSVLKIKVAEHNLRNGRLPDRNTDLGINFEFLSLSWTWETYGENRKHYVRRGLTRGRNSPLFGMRRNKTEVSKCFSPGWVSWRSTEENV